MIDLHPGQISMPKYKEEGIETAKIGVVLPVTLRQRLEAVAKSKGWSMSQTAAAAILEYVERAEQDKKD